MRDGAADPYRTRAVMPDGAALVNGTFVPRAKDADDREITAYFLMFKAKGKSRRAAILRAQVEGRARGQIAAGLRA